MGTFYKINKEQNMEKINFKKDYSEKTQILFEIDDFDKAYEKLEFVETDIDELIKLALDNRSEESDYERYHKESDDLYFATTYAVKILGKLGAIKPIEALVNKMYLNIESDAYHEAIIDYLGDIGVEAIDFIENELLTVHEDKLTLFDGLQRILKNTPSEKKHVSNLLVKYLETTDDNKSHLAFAISILVDLSGAEHIELIRKIFKTKEVDIMFEGDLEDIEIKLGLREKRSKPREKNFLEKMIEKYELEYKSKPILSVKNAEPKIGRNDPCPCGSGKKYKKCCLNK